MRQGIRAGVRMRLKGIKAVTKPDGRRYVYRRVGTKLVPLPDLPENDPAFLAAWAAAGTAPSPKPRKAGTVEALGAVYMASAVWRDTLARNTGDESRRHHQTDCGRAR